MWHIKQAKTPTCSELGDLKQHKSISKSWYQSITLAQRLNYMSHVWSKVTEPPPTLLAAASDSRDRRFTLRYIFETQFISQADRYMLSLRLQRYGLRCHIGGLMEYQCCGGMQITQTYLKAKFGALRVWVNWAKLACWNTSACCPAPAAPSSSVWLHLWTKYYQPAAH